MSRVTLHSPPRQSTSNMSSNVSDQSSSCTLPWIYGIHTASGLVKDEPHLLFSILLNVPQDQDRVDTKTFLPIAQALGFHTGGAMASNTACNNQVDYTSSFRSQIQDSNLFQGRHLLVCCPDSGLIRLPGVGGMNRSTPTRGGQTQGVVSHPGTTRRRCRSVSRACTTHEVVNHPNWKYMRTDVCGEDDTDRILGGEKAKLKQFPWLAHLGYKTKRGLRFLCGGSLIGNRYILTAAHCVKGLRNMRLESVRLGEHNTATDPDCEMDQDGRFCGNPIQDFNIDEVIVHPWYRSSSRNRHHDIALIRLDRETPLTDYIAPICIPNGAAVSKHHEGEWMFVAGWGKTENRSASNVKLWVRLPVMKNTECMSIYQCYLSLHENQLCAGSEQGRDSCQGDSGGPLMSIDSAAPERRGEQWVASGVVSIGPENCGREGWPGIYTRVGPYVKWILDNVKP